ncbi:MAG: IS1595 family transposase [Hyphomicrobiales bacterium]
MSNAFAAPHFHDDAAARALIESIRWPEGPVCSHCGTINHAYAVKNRAGLYRCAEPECRKDFTCTTGTVMERSKIALHKWMMGFYLMNASKKGVSAHQLFRALGVTYQTAWFMCHRIREAMRDGGLGPMGGPDGSGIVEADETYFGNIPESKRRTATTSGRPFTKKGKSGPSNKRAIVSLVERGGKVRSYHVPAADAATVAAIVNQTVAREARLHTDESKLYATVGAKFAAHETVNHSRKEYARGDVTTNSVEGYFSIFKRGMKGVYQHCDEKHLHRYLAEFDFRYNHRVALGYSDIDRTKAAILGTGGKRLTYHQTH